MEHLEHALYILSVCSVCLTGSASVLACLQPMPPPNAHIMCLSLENSWTFSCAATIPLVRAAQPLSPGPPVAALRTRPPAAVPSPALHAAARRPRAHDALWQSCTFNTQMATSLLHCTHTNNLAGLAKLLPRAAQPHAHALPQPLPPASRFAMRLAACMPLLLLSASTPTAERPPAAG